MNILIVKLITGDDVIADVERESPAGYVMLQKPVRMIPTPNGIVVVSMPPYDEHTLVVRNEHVVFTVEPDEELRNEYNSKFGSGLVVPGMSIVT